jgi:hypothetical protein
MVPRPCVLCGTVVEMVFSGTAHGTPFGCIPLLDDARFKEFAALMDPERRPDGIILPNLCWPCRGEVLNRSLR